MLGKATPWPTLARDARTEAAWSGRWTRREGAESRAQRWQDRGPRRRGLRTLREHGELTAFWGNTKLRSEAASKALGRGILVGVVGQRVELQARMRDKTPRPSAECRKEGVEAAVNGWLAQYSDYQRLMHRREESKAKQSKGRKEKKDKAARAKGRSKRVDPACTAKACRKEWLESCGDGVLFRRPVPSMVFFFFFFFSLTRPAVMGTRPRLQMFVGSNWLLVPFGCLSRPNTAKSRHLLLCAPSASSSIAC